MPRYYPIRRIKDDATRRRVIDRLLALRKQLKSDITDQCGPGSFLLATWNIRDFDSNKFGHGKRLPEAFHYIAEIISAFDLVAIQEVNRDLTALEKVMRLLGDGWDYLVTDTTEGASGNSERMAFVYRTANITFRNMAGEIVLPKGQKIVSSKKVKDDADPTKKTIEEDELQFARTPFLAAFQAGWFKFNLCTVHIYFGSSSGAKLKRRIEEIGRIAKFFEKRQKKEKEDYILLGDFNIVSPEHETMEALTGADFKIPENLKKEKTNLKGDKHYDQIALNVEDRRLEIGASGVFELNDSVFRNNDFAAYFDAMPAKKRDFDDDGVEHTPAQQKAYYRNKWRTFQMSDHLPMWVELKVDFTDDYLKSLRPGRTVLAD